MRVRTTWIITGILAVAAILVFVRLQKNKAGKEKATEARKVSGNTLLNVGAIVVQKTNLHNTVSATGTLTPNNEVTLTAEIAGRVTELNIQEGKPVTKGELLVKIYDADLKAQLAKSISTRNLATQRLKRLKTLLGKEGISQDEYDVGASEVQTAQADVDLIQAQIRKTEIRAPFSGVIGLKYISPGAYINSNTRIAMIQEVFPLKVDFTLPEKYQSLVVVGDVLNFTVSGSRETFKAKVAAIAPQIDLGSRNLVVRAICTHKDKSLKPGAFANIELNLSDIADAMMVPTQAIIAEQRGQKVYVVQGGKAIMKSVTTGIRTDSTVQILDGIVPGDSVITSGIMYLRPALPVKVVSSR